jgi:hypothetical protein
MNTRKKIGLLHEEDIEQITLDLIFGEAFSLVAVTLFICMVLVWVMVLS